MAYNLEEMRWPQVRDALDEGVRTVIVPTASTEQHGPALPLAVDTIRGDELGERVAYELDVFLAPTVRPGISEHHMTFPGTISLRASTFEAVVEDYCRSLARHGFRNIAFINTHGGNRESLTDTVAEMDRELDAKVFVAGDRDEMREIRNSAIERYDVTPEEAGAHGGAAETSFLMETHPELVSRADLSRGYVGEVDEEQIIEDGLDSVTENGVLGDQTKASRAAGRTLIHEYVNHYVDDIAQRRIEE